MGICYHCGRELEEARRCPHCNLTFCPEHMPQKEHNCIALSREFKVKQGGQPQMQPVEEEAGEQESPPVGARPNRVRYSTTEPEEAPQQRAKPRIKVDAFKVLVFCGIIALGAWSMNSLLEMKEETPADAPLFPVDQETLELQQYAIKILNEERDKNGSGPLNLDSNPIAQRYAEELARTNALKHNIQLPLDMGEAIRQYEVISPYSLKDLIQKNIDALINKDGANNNLNRALLLQQGYAKVSIGVATNKRYFYIVMDFSRPG